MTVTASGYRTAIDLIGTVPDERGQLLGGGHVPCASR
jgi:hypothetical protein